MRLSRVLPGALTAPDDGFGEELRVGCWDQLPPCTVRKDFSNSSGTVAGHYEGAEGQCFQEDQGHSLVAGREHKNVSVLEVGIGVGLEAGEADRIGQTQSPPLRLQLRIEGALAQNGQVGFWNALANQGHSLQEQIK